MRYCSLVLFISLLGVLCGCSEDIAPASTGGSGTLTGRITITDYRGRAKADKSGVLVQVDGTSFSTLTDSNGNWTIYNLPSQTYSLTFSKEGCYTWKDLSYSFLGGGVVRYEYLYTDHGYPEHRFLVPIGEFPKYQIFLDAIVPSKVIYGHTSEDGPCQTGLGVYLISGKQGNISIEDSLSYRNAYYFKTDFNLPTPAFYSASSRDTTIELVALCANLLDGYNSGDTVYFRAYPGIGNNSYYDAIKDKTVIIGYSNAGSNILSTVIP